MTTVIVSSCFKHPHFAAKPLTPSFHLFLLDIFLRLPLLPISSMMVFLKVLPSVSSDHLLGCSPLDIPSSQSQCSPCTLLCAQGRGITSWTLRFSFTLCLHYVLGNGRPKVRRWEGMEVIIGVPGLFVPGHVLTLTKLLY